MIRLAAAGDVHFDRSSRGRLARFWPELEGKACAFLLAGDLTQVGHEDEARALAADLKECPVPVVAILGNHDYHMGKEEVIKSILEDANVRVLDQNATVFHVEEETVGIYGTKGFCGGFMGACCSDFGEQEIKSFVGHTKGISENLKDGLMDLQTDYKVALLHYSPTAQTLLGEKKEIYPFLGSYMLAEAVDRGGADIVFHGHAHKGTERGKTLGGVPVRNVAQPVIRYAFKIYSLDELGDEIAQQEQKSEPPSSKL